MRPADEILTDLLRKAAREAWPALPDARAVSAQPATKPEFGDYQCNAAMGLAGALKAKPRDIAEGIVEALAPSPLLAKAEVAGPGFINLQLSDAWLAERLEAMGKDERLGVEPTGSGRTVVVDFSSPNVCKTMHVGHLRSTIIGHALVLLHRFLGYRVIGDNHLGDWGTQFGILIMAYRRWGDEARLAAEPVEEMEQLYRRGYEAAEADASLREEARRELVKLHEGEPENRRLWERFVAYSLEDLNRLYERLGVSFDTVRGESAYHEMLDEVVRLLKEAGVARKSEGAQAVFFGEGEGNLPPFLVQKRDGAFNYATTDLATLRHRLDGYQPTKILYVTDARQQLHFQQLFATARRLGWDRGVELEHLWFGSILGEDGKPLKTREGAPPRLRELLDEAERRALAVVREASQGFTEEEQREIARSVGKGAVFYADLSQNRQSDYVFSYDRMLALDGNTAPYILYTYARARSIRRKYEERIGEFRGAKPRLEHPAERALAAAAARFAEVVRDAAAGYKLNLITEHAYQLATTLNKQFYHQLPVLQSESPVRESRLALTELVAAVLKRGLGLLGIGTLERM